MSGGHLEVRPVDRGSEADRAAVIEIARYLVDTDTYVFAAETTDDELWDYFAPSPPGAGFVAELDGMIVGVMVIRPNLAGRGSHVANASFAVNPQARGRGVGRTMGERAIELAAAAGYRAMQFNTVVATNDAAVQLWTSLGFEIIGTVPDGFRLGDGSYVDHHVMYRSLGSH